MRSRFTIACLLLAAAAIATLGGIGSVSAHEVVTKAQRAEFKADAARAQARLSAIKATVTAARARKYRYATRTLQMGMTGGDVVKLQKYLNGLALPTVVDGVYGKGTKRSVVGFERARPKIRVDGRVQRNQAKKIRQAAKKRRTATGFIFPVRGAHSYGGPDSAFGAPRGDHAHQGQDVAAACGTPLVAAQGGTVRVNAFQASGAGNYVVIRGSINAEDYAYMHMVAPSPLPVGAVVPTGGAIGAVGNTGGSTGCHLHFEMWTVPGWRVGGFPYDPKPSLLLWDSYS